MKGENRWIRTEANHSTHLEVSKLLYSATDICFWLQFFCSNCVMTLITFLSPILMQVKTKMVTSELKFTVLKVNWFQYYMYLSLTCVEKSESEQHGLNMEFQMLTQRKVWHLIMLLCMCLKWDQVLMIWVSLQRGECILVVPCVSLLQTLYPRNGGQKI